MRLPIPDIPILKSYPRGADPVAVFPDRMLTLTYWDLWALISAKHRFGSELLSLRASLVDRRLNRMFHSMWRKELLEDLIALVDDLSVRLKNVGSVDDILAVIPERLLKKETQKGIKNITDDWGGSDYPPSEPMLRSPRRLLEKEAMRGMWSKLPFDPTPIAELLRPLFIPNKKKGFFPKGTTFALSRRVERAINKELAKEEELTMNRHAYRYAIHRAALMLFHEEHHWDDSYGVMGDLGQRWVDEILLVTADDLCLDPCIFLKDLLMFLCWENYGLSDNDNIAAYIRRLSGGERGIAIDILLDIKTRAAQGFQQFNADNAANILEKIKACASSTPVLEIVKPLEN